MFELFHLFDKLSVLPIPCGIQGVHDYLIEFIPTQIYNDGRRSGALRRLLSGIQGRPSRSDLRKDLDPAVPWPKLSDFVAPVNGSIDADDDEDGGSDVGQDSEGDADSDDD